MKRALCITIWFICISTFAAAEQVRSRVLRFPKGRSLGMLRVQDASTKERRNAIYWEDDIHNWEYLGQAAGDVNIPQGKRLWLVVSRTGVENISPLKDLRPNDLYMLSLPYTEADDTCMPHLAGLTGLKVLYLRGTKITNKGLEFIRGLRSLRRLTLAPQMDDAGLNYLGELTSLKTLNLSGTSISVAGLSRLPSSSSLQELYLGKSNISESGLAGLAKLTSLTCLNMRGSNIEDAELVHLKNLASLKILNLGNGGNITNEGLAHLSNLTGLEELDLFGTTISDEGLAYLKPMRSLKKLNLSNTHIGDNGLFHLKEIKSLESLRLPYRGVTDRGMAYLVELDRLKYLSVGGSPTGDQISDEGLKLLTKCRLLEELSVGGEGITDAGMIHIAKLTTLKVLLLQNCPITNEGLAKLSTLKALNKLTLHNGSNSINMEITSSGLSCLAALPSLASLRVYKLNLDESPLNIAGLIQLKELDFVLVPLRDEDLVDIGKLTRLKRFSFQSDAFRDEGMAHLSGLTSLEHLTVGGAFLTDDGLSHLTNMNNLVRLRISGDFSDEGLVHLEALESLRELSLSGIRLTKNWRQNLKDMSKLQSFSIRASGISEEELEELKQIVPNCRVYTPRVMRITAPPRPQPKQPASLVGKALPKFEGININFSPDSAKERKVLMCLWDMNQRPSRNCLMQLSKKASELKAKDIVVIAVHASKVDQAKLNEWVKKNNIAFSVGMIQGDVEKTRFTWGVRSLPWLILADRNHQVITEGFGLNELEDRLEETNHVGQ